MSSPSTSASPSASLRRVDLHTGEDLSRDDLIALQRDIASRVVLEDGYSLGVVAGMDMTSIEGEDGSATIVSGVVVLDPSHRVLERAHAVLETNRPYVPGLLFFREGTAAVLSVMRLKARPTLLFVNRCGINHPRMAGLASHLGVLLEMPTIGVTKSVLCGSFSPPDRVGDASPLLYRGRKVGHVFLSKKDCRPIVVAPGHLVSMRSALDLVRHHLAGHRLPEPCQVAHRYVKEVKRQTIHRRLDSPPSPGASSSGSCPGRSHRCR